MNTTCVSLWQIITATFCYHYSHCSHLLHIEKETTWVSSPEMNSLFGSFFEILLSYQLFAIFCYINYSIFTIIKCCRLNCRLSIRIVRGWSQKHEFDLILYKCCVLFISRCAVMPGRSFERMRCGTTLPTCTRRSAPAIPQSRKSTFQVHPKEPAGTSGNCHDLRWTINQFLVHLNLPPVCLLLNI